MKIESLKEYIRQEVKNAVKQELKEYLFEAFVQKKDVSTPPITENSENTKINEGESSKPKKIVKYTKNEALNKVLNETIGGVPKEGSYVGFMNEGLDNKSAESAIPDNAPEPIKNVVNAMNRDYRSLLKAVDKKRSSGKS